MNARRSPTAIPAGRALAARVVTGLFGGYALAAVAAALIARLLPAARADATAWGLNLAFAIMTAAFLWAFAEPRLRRVVTVLWGGSAAGLALLLALGLRP